MLYLALCWYMVFYYYSDASHINVLQTYVLVHIGYKMHLQNHTPTGIEKNITKNNHLISVYCEQSILHLVILDIIFMKWQGCSHFCFLPSNLLVFADSTWPKIQALDLPEWQLWVCCF